MQIFKNANFQIMQIFKNVLNLEENLYKISAKWTKFLQKYHKISQKWQKSPPKAPNISKLTPKMQIFKTSKSLEEKIKKISEISPKILKKGKT